MIFMFKGLRLDLVIFIFEILKLICFFVRWLPLHHMSLVLVSTWSVTDLGRPDRVRTHPGNPGIYWNLIIRIPGLEYTGI